MHFCTDHRVEFNLLWRQQVEFIKSNQNQSNLKNFYSAPYNNGRERLTKYIGLIIKCEVKYNIGVSKLLL